MKNKIKIGIIAGTSCVCATGVGTALVVVSTQMHKKPIHQPDIQMQNVYSIRDYLIKRYTKILTDAGDTQEYINLQVQKIENDVDKIIEDGIKGNFPISNIYNKIYGYGHHINIDLYDWTMLDKFVDNSLKSLLETLTKSGLPKDKVNKIYTHYRELTLNETKKCKQASESPAEIIDHMKKFGKEIAVEAMADDYEELARYHIDNFATSAKIQLVDRLAYYYDNLKLDATSQDNVIPLLTEILEYDNQPINGNTINEILKQANLNSLQGKEINYELTAKIQSFDDEHNLVDIIFYIKDLIHLDNKGKPIVKKASKVFQFYLPYSPIQENKLIADDLKHYQFNFVKNVTFANWGGVIETIKTVTDSKNFPIDVKKKEPITDLISSMSTIFTVDNKPLKDHKIFQKYSFKLNVYGYDEKTNAIDFEVIVSMPNDNTIHDSQSSQEYWNNDVPFKLTRGYTLFSRQVINFPVASEVEISQLHEAIEQNNNMLKVYSQSNLDELEKIYGINVAYTAEQATMATTLGIMAGIYYAAVPVSFGATLGSAISCTMAAAACVYGTVLGGKLCHSINSQIETIKKIITNEVYSIWLGSSLNLAKHLHNLVDLKGKIPYISYCDLQAEWMDVKFAAQELFLKFSEAQSYGFFMSFFNIGVDYVRDVLKHDPTKIISSFIYREEDKTRRFLNGNFEGFRYAINQFHQGGHWEDYLKNASFTTRNGDRINYFGLEPNQKKAFDNLFREVIWEPNKIYGSIQKYLEDHTFETTFKKYVDAFIYDIPLEDVHFDVMDIQEMFETSMAIVNDFAQFTTWGPIAHDIDVDLIENLKTCFHHLWLCDIDTPNTGHFFPDTGPGFLRFPFNKKFSELCTRWRPGGSENLKREEFDALYDESWNRFVQEFFDINPVRPQYCRPIKIRGAIYKKNQHQEWEPNLRSGYDKNTRTFFINASNDDVFMDFLDAGSTRSVQPSWAKYGSFEVTENGGDIVGEVRGIKGFKAYLATHVSYLEDLSLIQEMAIFACPTLETIIGLSDLILQVTFNLLTSTYKPF